MHRSRLLRLLAATILIAACTRGPGTSVTATDSTAEPSTTPIATAPENPTASPPPTDEPLPTVFIPESDSLEAGLRYTCGGTAFPIEILEGPGDLHLDGDRATIFLRTGTYSEFEWWLIRRTPSEAEYVGRFTDGTFNFARLERDSRGDWGAGSYGTCHLRAVVDDDALRVVTWWIREQDWPEPGDTELKVRARDGCIETLRDQLAEPIIRYGEDRILMILAAEPDESRPYPCGDDPVLGGPQVIGLTIPLSEPVGDRTLWDGAAWPLRDAHVPSEELIFCCG